MKKHHCENKSTYSIRYLYHFRITWFHFRCSCSPMCFLLPAILPLCNVELDKFLYWLHTRGKHLLDRISSLIREVGTHTTSKASPRFIEVPVESQSGIHFLLLIYLFRIRRQRFQFILCTCLYVNQKTFQLYQMSWYTRIFS
jgi:hypothetical protein